MTITAPTLNARTIVDSAICQQIIRERDEAQDLASRYREAIVHVRGEHGDDGNGFCTGDHAAQEVPFPCEVRDACDEALRPSSNGHTQ